MEKIIAALLIMIGLIVLGVEIKYGQTRLGCLNASFNATNCAGWNRDYMNSK